MRRGCAIETEMSDDDADNVDGNQTKHDSHVLNEKVASGDRVPARAP